ncbi:ATP-binding protein [Pseudomonas fluorescens]|uniref:ATP-binding protein n=1 Tax=Pseudomonas fluorescens TaxID=294 RepID=UPI001CA76E1C|nr:ATP-binding protein [Pseudomonas fluorescens]MBY8933988.1 ATP-binding protein [Pseudomonas fluorescens]
MFDGFVLSLKPSPVIYRDNQSESLFAANSMMLLVGPNGGGKTRALATLAALFGRKVPGDVAVPEVMWDSPTESADTCAIYYTPVPYHIDIPKNSDNFCVVQTSLEGANRPLSIQHREIADELKKEFGLDARRTLTLSGISQRVLGEIMARAHRYQVADSWFEKFHAVEIQHIKDLKAVRVEGKDYSSYNAIDEAREVHVGEFAIEMRKNLGTEFFLKIRAYELARAGRSTSSTAEKQLLIDLGFTLNTALSRSSTVPRQKFHSAMEQLSGVAEIIRDPLLRKNSYQVDDDQVRRLTPLLTKKVGQLKLTGLSSGAAALIHQFASINSAAETLLSSSSNRNLVLLIDEGDAFLHLEWQQHYIDYLDKTAQKLKEKFDSVQIVIASHSPVLMADFPRECIVLLKNQNWIEGLLDESAQPSSSASLGAPLDAIVRNIGQTGTMGKFATRVIRQLVKDVATGSRVRRSRVEMIGDPVIKRQVSKMLDERGQWEHEE